LFIDFENVHIVVFVFLEFSDAILVRAVRSYTDNHVGVLNFSEGDCITVCRLIIKILQKQNLKKILYLGLRT